MCFFSQINVTASDINKVGTVTIYVIDEETGELFNEDRKNFYILGGGPGKNGLSGTICPGEWNSGQSNPHVFEDLPDNQYSIHYTMSSYDNYNYVIDEDRSEDSFDFSEETEKTVRIYMKKFYWTINPTTAVCRGDADLNGLVELADITVVAKYNLSNEAYPLANDTAYANADMNGDSKVDGLDTSALIENQLGK